jgi:hypothetical protein
MASATSYIVFDDIFTINAIDKEGKKFDRGPSAALYPTFIRRLRADMLPTISLSFTRPFQEL